MSDDPLFNQFRQDFLALEHHPGVHLELTAIEAWMLLGQIQIACRHPENNGISRATVEKLARQIQAGLAVTPALAAVAERGWDPAYDEEIERS